MTACPIECGCGAECHAAHIPMCFRPHTPRTCPASSWCPTCGCSDASPYDDGCLCPDCECEDLNRA